MADAPKPSSSVKLVLLGEAAVGKSSLVLRFVNNDFQENKEPTIGGRLLSRTDPAPFPPHTSFPPPPPSPPFSGCVPSSSCPRPC